MPGSGDSVRTDKYDKADLDQDFEAEMESELQVETETEMVGQVREAPLEMPAPSAAHNPMSAAVMAQSESVSTDPMLFDPMPVEYEVMESEEEELLTSVMGGGDEEDPPDGDPAR